MTWGQIEVKLFRHSYAAVLRRLVTSVFMTAQGDSHNRGAVYGLSTRTLGDTGNGREDKGSFKCDVTPIGVGGGGGVSNFPEKNVTNVYKGSTLLALRGGGSVSNFPKKRVT